MKWTARFLGRVLLMLVALAVLAGVVMWLWNVVVPTLFVGANVIDYPRALGLLILSRILFGGFRGHGGWHGGWHGRHRWERWQAMTPEERERFRHGRPWGRHAARSE